MPKQFAGKDWTKYEGLLHTDYAIREKFFDGREMPPTEHDKPLMDFTYLYDDMQPDFVSFVAGEPFTEEQVYADIDWPEHWYRHDVEAGLISRTPDQTAEVSALLEACLQLGEIWRRPRRGVPALASGPRYWPDGWRRAAPSEFWFGPVLATRRAPAALTGGPCDSSGRAHPLRAPRGACGRLKAV